MTGFLHEKEFSPQVVPEGRRRADRRLQRRWRSGSPARRRRPVSPFASNGRSISTRSTPGSRSMLTTPASIKTGGIRQGTGSDTGLLMIAGEELDMDMSQLKFVDGGHGHDAEYRACTPRATRSCERGPRRPRGCGVGAQTLLGLASTQLGVPASQLSVSKGVVSGGGKSVTYGAAARRQALQRPDAGELEHDRARRAVVRARYGRARSRVRRRRSRSASTSSSARSPPRIDIPAIVTGTQSTSRTFGCPGCCTGASCARAARRSTDPARRSSRSTRARSRTSRTCGSSRKGDFLGVVAPNEYDAIQAAAQLKVKWADPPAVLPGAATSSRRCGRSTLPARRFTTPNPVERCHVRTGRCRRRAGAAAHVVTCEYGWPTNIHTPIGPQCAVADVTPQGARIFSGTQGPYQDQRWSPPSSVCPDNGARHRLPRWADASATARSTSTPPGGGTDVPGRRCTRACAADALGRDRLGQTAPGR